MKKNDPLAQKADEWLVKGDNDLTAAAILLNDSESPTDVVCFHCQQAVEKYLKAALTQNGIDFIKSHDLEYLLKLIGDRAPGIDAYSEKILSLNKYSIEPRYPADLPVIYSKEEAQEALKSAKEIAGYLREFLSR